MDLGSSWPDGPGNPLQRTERLMSELLKLENQHALTIPGGVDHHGTFESTVIEFGSLCISKKLQSKRLGFGASLVFASANHRGARDGWLVP